MPDPDEIDFAFTGAPRPADADEDVIELGPRRPIRRSVLVAMAIVAAVAVIIGVVVNGHNHKSPVAAPSVASSTPARPAPSSSFDTAGDITPSEVGRALRTGGSGGALDVAVGADRRFILTGSALVEQSLQTQRVVATAPVRDLAYLSQGPTYRLVVDEASDRIWLVREGGVTGAYVVEFDAATLRRLATVPVAGTIQDAAVLDGTLYLAARELLKVTAQGGVAVAVPVRGNLGYLGAIAADPLRHRLLVMNVGFPTRVVSVDPGGSAGGVSASLDLGQGSMAVVRGSIWAGGFGQGGAVLERLDPISLRPVAAAPDLTHRFASGALVVASGSSVLWVRSDDGDGLWCVNGTDGAIRQYWADLPGTVASQDLAGPVTSREATAYAASGDSVVPLVLTSCAG